MHFLCYASYLSAFDFCLTLTFFILSTRDERSLGFTGVFALTTVFNGVLGAFFNGVLGAFFNGVLGAFFNGVLGAFFTGGLGTGLTGVTGVAGGALVGIN